MCRKNTLLMCQNGSPISVWSPLSLPKKLLCVSFLKKDCSCVWISAQKNSLCVDLSWKNSTFMFWSLKKFSCACPLWKKFLSLSQRNKIPRVFSLPKKSLCLSSLPSLAEKSHLIYMATTRIFYFLFEDARDIGSIYMCDSLGGFHRMQSCVLLGK